MRCAITRVLPEPGPGQDEQRALRLLDGFALAVVQVIENGGGGGRHVSIVQVFASPKEAETARYPQTGLELETPLSPRLQRLQQLVR